MNEIPESFANHNQSRKSSCGMGGRIYEVPHRPVGPGDRGDPLLLEGLPVQMHGIVGQMESWNYPFSEDRLHDRWTLYKALFIGGFTIPDAKPDWSFVLRLGEKNYYHWNGPEFQICPPGFEYLFGLFAAAPHCRFTVYPAPGTPVPLPEGKPAQVCENGLRVTLHGLFMREIC